MAIAVLLGEEIGRFVDEETMTRLRACQTGIIDTLRRSAACGVELHRQLLALGRGLAVLGA